MEIIKAKFFINLNFMELKKKQKNMSDGKCFLQTYNLFYDTTGHETNEKFIVIHVTGHSFS